MRLLKEFYADVEKDQNSYFLKKTSEIRRFAIENFPYKVAEDGDAVILNGRKITKFASQLDYVMLTLATNKPKELYEKARKINS